eukprot:s6040_g8.t1
MLPAGLPGMNVRWSDMPGSCRGVLRFPFDTKLEVSDLQSKVTDLLKLLQHSFQTKPLAKAERGEQPADVLSE